MERKDKPKTAQKEIPKKKRKLLIHHRNAVHTRPLATDLEGLNNSNFLDKVDAGLYDKREKRRKKGTHKFKNDFCRQVYYLAKGGFRSADIAEFFHVDITTVEMWKATNKDFLEAWREGSYMLGFKVVDSLYNRALGYDYVEFEHSQHVDRFGEIRDLTKKTFKHMPPEIEAIKFILKNRFKENWSDTNRTEIEAVMQIDLAKRLDLTILTDEEQHLVKSIALKQIKELHGVSSE